MLDLKSPRHTSTLPGAERLAAGVFRLQARTSLLPRDDFVDAAGPGCESSKPIPLARPAGSDFRPRLGDRELAPHVRHRGQLGPRSLRTPRVVGKTGAAFDRRVQARESGLGSRGSWR